MLLPSGDHEKMFLIPTLEAKSVVSGAEPFVGFTKKSLGPLRLDWNAIRLPSGDQMAKSARAGSMMNRVEIERSRSTSQMSDWDGLSERETAANFPSRETPANS